MKFPWTKPTTKTYKKRRPLTIDDEERRLKLKLDKTIAAAAYEGYRNLDNDTKRDIAFQKFGYQPKAKESDITKKLNEKIDDATLAAIEDNPDLLQKIALARAKSLVGGGSSDGGLKQALDAIRSYKELEDEFGGEKSGGLIGDDAKEFIKELIKNAPAIIGAVRGAPPAQKIFVVEVNGQIMEMNSEQYQQHLAEVQRLQLQAGQATVTVTSSVESPKKEFSISGFVEYLEREPEDVVSELVAGAKNGDNNATLAINLLSKYNTAEDMLKFLRNFKLNDEAKVAIEKLEEKKDWLQRAIDYYKTRRK